MHRLVAILLIPIFAVGNAFAHSHGQSAHSLKEHGRAHFHVGNESHHGAGHESHDHDHGHSLHDHHQHSHNENNDCRNSNAAQVAASVEHDSDAIYIPSVDLAFNCINRTSVPITGTSLGDAAATSFADRPAKTRHPQLDRPPLLHPIPLYVLNAALLL